MADRAAVAPRPAAVEVGDIFRAHGAVYRRHHPMSDRQSKVFDAIQQCRTAALGGHLQVCSDCGFSRPAYNSCRDRHCPKCQSLRQAQWLELRRERLLPVPYFHVVFTLPGALRRLCRRNDRAMYNLLFSAASQTLLRLGQDPKWLGGRLAVTAVLHTWTRELQYHPHLHCIVSGGGLSLDGTRWILGNTRYLFPVAVLSALFRGLFVDGLKKLVEREQVRLDGQDFSSLLRKAGSWVGGVSPCPSRFLTGGGRLHVVSLAIASLGPPHPALPGRTRQPFPEERFETVCRRRSPIASSLVGRFVQSKRRSQSFRDRMTT